MTTATYRQAPEDIASMPSGVPYIVGNELAERFSYYGMKTILMVFMTHYLKDAAGHGAPLHDTEATATFHLFAAGSYFFPILGAILADALFGKYRTIIVLSLVYCLGHFALALDETRTGLYLGLSLAGRDRDGGRGASADQDAGLLLCRSGADNPRAAPLRVARNYRGASVQGVAGLSRLGGGGDASFRFYRLATGRPE